MINPQIRPLVITPFPKRAESLLGFILRTSEANGYESPSLILRHAGLTENEIRSARPPFEKLAHLFARKPEDFQQMGYSDQPDNRYDKRLRILNHRISGMYVDIKQARICPECIQQDGYIDSFFDLKYSLACPTHARMAIASCPVCGKALRNNRQGLLTCTCGHDLSDERGDPIGDSIRNILELIKCKLHGSILGNARLENCGFPLSDLEEMSISTLCGIISRLEPGKKRKTRFNIPTGVSVELHALKLASDMLSRWPHGFYDHLEAHYELNAPPVGSTLQKQFHTFNCAFFKSGLPTAEVAFMQDAFMRFGNERWKTNGFVDPRFSKRLNTSSNIVGMKGLAEHLGIMVPTAENYVENGIIIGEKVDTASTSRWVFDLTLLPFKKAEGPRHRLREAARFLGIPVKLLAMLRKNGTYRITRLAWGLDGYSQLDLIEFRTKLLEKAPLTGDFDAKEFITLKKIMYKKLGGQDVPAKIIAAVLEGKIVPVGRSGDAIGDLILNRNIAMSLIAPN